MEIYALATGITDDVLTDFSEVHLVERIDDGLALITIPHYQPFTDLVPQLTEAGVHFIEFAGSDHVMLSAFAPHDWSGALTGTEIMFQMPVLVDPAHQRLGLNIPVANLHNVLAEMAAQDMVVEHIYDY
ncbi:MAG: hypothetical protein R2932_11960 [Caldilineaceae bacterium]